MQSINENILIKSFDYLSNNDVQVCKINLFVDYKNLENYKNNLKTCSINSYLEDIKNKNFTETELFLDKTTLSQLTPKFIKSISNSEWSKLYLELEKAYKDYNYELIKKIASKFAEGLTKDLDNYNQNSPISDCSLFASRNRSTFNRPEHHIRIVNEIINILYLNTGILEILNDGKIRYSKLISKLSKKYVEQYTKIYLSNNKYKLFRLLEHDKKNWELLKNKPLTNVITEPQAMPVDIASLDELEPFFKFLNSNSIPIDNNFENEKCMKFIRGALFQNKRMDLCKQVVGPNYIQMLMNSLVNNEQVEHFLLGNNIIGQEGGKAIGKFLLQDHKPKIKTWYLAGNDLDEEGIRWICDGLKYDKDCESLWLKRNPIKPEGIKYISELIKINTTYKDGKLCY